LILVSDQPETTDYAFQGDFSKNAYPKQTIVYQQIKIGKLTDWKKKETHLPIPIEKVGLALNNSLT
jgi:hypothetical protein